MEEQILTVTLDAIFILLTALQKIVFKVYFLHIHTHTSFSSHSRERLDVHLHLGTNISLGKSVKQGKTAISSISLGNHSALRHLY